jgi:two-component system cell cycle response regulator
MQICGLENFVRDETRSRPAALQELPKRPRSCRVLVVDDDEIVRASLIALLRTHQFDVEAAASGEEALRIMLASPCDILLTDWQMPDMDGLSLCHRVRDARPDRYVYVLLHTVRDGKQDLLTGLAAGADDYVVKGAPIAELLARLEVGRRITDRPASKRSRDEEWRPDFTDPLTGSGNLRHLVRHLPRALARARRHDRALAVLNCAVDEFKQITERLGSEIGDDLLRAFVARSECCLRSGTDWVARTSADEFIIVLPESDVQRAQSVARSLREAFLREAVPTGGGPVTFTVSIGLTVFEPKHLSRNPPKVQDMLRAAERGLRASKQCGGNHITAAAVSSRRIIDVASLLQGGGAVH